MSDVAPSPIKIQVEQTSFRDPVSESLMQDMGASLNYLLNNINPVGTVVDSMLTESQFQAQQFGSTTWVLADGRDVTGSTYANLVASTIPDFRGKFRRGKNNGASGAGYNPDGDLALGTFEADQNQAHIHTGTTMDLFRDTSPFGTPATNGASFNSDIQGTGTPSTIIHNAMIVNITSNGGADARPMNITVNSFIRIN